MELYHEWQKDRTGWFLTADEIEGLNQSTLINQEIMSEEELILECIVKDDYTDMTNTQIKLKLELKYPSFRTTTKRIGLALKKCGFEPVVKMLDGKTQRIYNVKFKNEDITHHF